MTSFLSVATRSTRFAEAYPEFTFCHNADWENNNILASLFHAEDEMDEGFICAYSDILFTPDAVGQALAHPADAALVIDTEWLAHYADRSQHPSDDAEKVTVSNGRITRIERCTPEAEAHGEYTGVAKFTAAATNSPANLSVRPSRSRRPTSSTCSSI